MDKRESVREGENRWEKMKLVMEDKKVNKRKRERASREKNDISRWNTSTRRHVGNAGAVRAWGVRVLWYECCSMACSETTRTASSVLSPVSVGAQNLT